ncbi:MAG: imidazole glycerol phosphate synthase subunit HisH [Alphaproteobacteria bacterium]|jgi:glutamine amidotransferase|nr:imidazole glycerol phosphate synthase subunit HisH [Alphaproteobacteria bacterium]MDP7223311.1 imidazole glycerol phosphate synthase subunit HisH [Alphaproteobacteria bacterium]
MTQRDLVIIDSGGANIASVLFAFERLGQKAVLTADPDKINAASHVILPGVGAAADAMTKLRAQDGLIDCIRGLTQPVMGICLGMQLLFSFSEEGDVDLLGLIDGRVSKFKQHSADMTIPHMGWNNVVLEQPDHPLLQNVGQNVGQNPAQSPFFYFVHSYRADMNDHTIGRCTYGDDFTAIVARGNVAGCQFHPERSGKAGAKILENFLAL